MARTPKDVPAPVPARGGRKPKSSATPPGPVTAGDSGAASGAAVEADAAIATTAGQQVQGRLGRASKQQPKTAISSVFESSAGKQPVADVDPLEAAAGPGLDQDDAPPAETALSVSAGEGSDAPSGDASRGEPAAQWDRATDTVRFDWAEIERTASRDGPNQAMAKLLVAARAEGANSRWPL